MDGDAGGTPPTPPRRQSANIWLIGSLHIGGIVLLIMACALPMYGPDAAAQLYLQHIAWCLSIVGFMCILSLSLIGLPYRPPKQWLLPAWRALAAAEIAVTTAAFVLFVVQPSSAGQLSEELLQVAIAGIWICFAAGLVLGIQGRTSGALTRTNTQSGSATRDIAHPPHDETGSRASL